MDVALIAPFEMLSQSSFGKYHLMLPQLIAEPRYVRHFSRMMENRDKYIILDNGAAEGAAIDWDHLLSIAWAYQVDEMVLPDVLGDPLATYHAARAFLEQVGSAPQKLGYVLHGRNVQETVGHFYHVLQSPWLNEMIDVWHVPRRLLVDTGDIMARYNVGQVISQHDTNMRPIHFLGMHSLAPVEPRMLSKVSRARSLDTSLPYVYAMHDRHYDALAGQFSTPANRPDNYFDFHLDGQMRVMAINNCQTLEQYAKDE